MSETSANNYADLIRNVKVYFDGSSYIGIPHTTKPKGKTKVRPTFDPNKQAFERAYAEVKELPKKDRKQAIVKMLGKVIPNTEEYVEKGIERKNRNRIAKRTRLWRKARLQTWNFFCTFTYDSKKHTEDSFKKSLSNCLKHLSSRRGWKYIGVWERSPENKRLHFHALMYIPDKQMLGEIVEVKDYDTKAKRMQTTYQNTHFNEKYGRSDFKEITPYEVDAAITYLVKYIEKDGGRIVYSKGLPQYFVCDVMEEDVIAKYGVDDRKLLLTDNFNVWDNGEYLACVCPAVIDLLPKAS